jgi:transposase
MLLMPLLPDPVAVSYSHLSITPDLIGTHMFTVGGAGICPACGQLSKRVHSHYQRLLADLPWCGTPVQIFLQVRRFHCDNPGCSRRTFVEQVPQLAGHHARKTCRLALALRQIGFHCGGEAGSRLAAALGMPVSADTMLDLIRRTSISCMATPLVLGVDDWAFHKGQSYGTILCDMEKHQVIDLLPDRSAESFAAWLIAHPGVQIISRDRGEYYANGAKAGAPHARQVADRFHLLCNVREALKRAADRCVKDVLEAGRIAAAVAKAIPLPESAQQFLLPVAQATGDIAPAQPLTKAQQAKEASRARRSDRYSRVMELHRQGVSLRQIGQQLHIHRGTVRKFVRADQFPETATRQYAKTVDPFAAYLHQRWDEGCHNSVELTKEIRKLGFTGSGYMVRRLVADWREPDAASRTTGPTPACKGSGLLKPSSNRISWLLLLEEEDRTEEEQAFIEALGQRRPELLAAGALAREFAVLLHDRKAESLDDWIQRTHAVEVAPELAGFADGLKQDYEAVRAAFELDWSNGQVEGQVNRLKLIKRQMYGRAGFELLRTRVLKKT